ncbi:MAG: alanine dehydrogenase [Polyangiaceae bacterium]|nr:alanine dehydrogenase [Polyangiaceae bacterium]
MIVGVPRETKQHEYRVGMLPAGVESLTRAGHRVLVEQGAGLGSGIADAEYATAGAALTDPSAIWATADLVVKVKEPQAAELTQLRAGQVVFTYFHFAADRALTEAVIASGATAVAYETLREANGKLPLLTPMSEVAGRMSIQEGAKCLERPQHGRGILLGGVPGVAPAVVVILGGGVVGSNAAKVAAGFGAHVTVLDINLDRLRYLDETLPGNVTTLFSDRYTIRDELARADLVIGAALIPGARAPVLIERADLARMQAGAVFVDVAIDQGGSAETSRPTNHDVPTYVVDGIVHYCVANIPGAVACTSSYALCNATLPYALKLANLGLPAAARQSRAFAEAVNVHEGRLTNAAVAQAFDMSWSAYVP